MDLDEPLRVPDLRDGNMCRHEHNALVARLLGVVLHLLF